MTESFGVEPGPLPLLGLGLGEGTILRFVRLLDLRGWTLLGAAALCIALPGVLSSLGGTAHAGAVLEERKLPMRFSWVACEPNCRGWVKAVGIINTTADQANIATPFAFGLWAFGALFATAAAVPTLRYWDVLASSTRWLGALPMLCVSLFLSIVLVAAALVRP